MTRRTALLTTLAGACRAYSKEFWNEKKPSDWTAEEIGALINKSPWAKEAAVSYYGGQNGPLGNNTGGSHRSARGNASSGTSPSAASPAAWKAIVRWESALPVREALKLKATPDLEKYYILNVIGDVPSGGAAPEFTKLEHKGDEIHLHHIAASPKTDMSLPGTLFYFSRGLALRTEDKVATFSTKLGPIDLKAKFTLKEMLYRGSLEL